ncbi:MAG TPA: PRD domain-containing protein [Arachnia sp.]|nr:PRD domain-containing protein [Arachnia sp.]HMT84903.1 PRD domain-containing protein [Arachnia sp.]
MKILQVFNNNVVLAVDELGREVVLTGRGLGFQRRRGDEVEEARIGRRFVPADNPGAVAQLLADIPPDLLTLVDVQFSAAVRSLGAAMPPLAIIAAADHIFQAIERVRRGETMDYPLRVEVAHLLPEELRVAEELLARLNSHLPVTLPDGEATALAMHLFHAVTGNASMEQTFVHTALIRQIFDLIAEAQGPGFDPGSIDAARFAAHLRYFFARAESGRQFHGDVGAIGRVLTVENPSAYQLALRIRSLLELRLNFPVSEDEVVYLTIHLARLVMASRA